VNSDRAHSVLIVEDERAFARELQQSLNGMGYDAFAVASSCDEAIARVSERCPDVVLMDIQIQGARDGIETAALLHRSFDVPVVYLTAHADERTIARAKITAPYGYLLKPVKPAELRSVIELSVHRHGMERQLRERERWFAITLRSIQDAVITVDLAGNVTFMNPAAERLAGRTAAQAIGQPARDILPLLDPERLRPLESPLDQALRERRPGSRDAAVVRARTGHRRVSDSASPVSDGGELLGAVMVCRDVTDQQRVQRQLEVADRLASLGTMASGVAHQINNPLAVVVANADYLRAEIDDIADALVARGGDGDAAIVDRLRELSDVQGEISSAGSRIGKIVGDLHAFSRPPERSSAEADVSRAIAWAVRTTAHELRARARLRHEPVDLPLARGDEQRLGQVIVNLLMNAAQAIPPGKISNHEVAIRARREADRIVIEVKDTGPGIAPGDLSRIFEPFFTTKTLGEGTGLGLSVCHGIVTSMGGEIQVESEIGKGTVFRVILPVAGTAAVSEPAPPPVTTASRRGRVLVIDDDEMVHRTIARLLRDHDLTCVGSAREALDRIARQRFDAILSEVMMPVMTGVELYDQLLTSDPAHARRIVFVTGGASATPQVADFLRSIPNPTLEKPFGMPELQALIARMIDAPV
jgi:PAS domain S-box-containing protein